MSPFQILGIPPSFELPTLEQQVKDLQIQHHPDRFVGHQETQVQAQERFSQIVWAYEELKERSKRAEWLLKEVEHWPIVQETSLLEEMMELEEALSEGTLTSIDLKILVQKVEAELIQDFAQQKWELAGQRYMRWTILLRLLKRG